MEQLTYYTIESFPYSVIVKAGIQKRKKGNQGRKNNDHQYKDLYCAFDIEATNDLDLGQAFMYIWQFQIEEYTIIGRTWAEFLTFLNRIKMQLKQNEHLMIYVHNLSYEFSFLKGIYQFDSDDVFCINPRKVLKCSMFECFEFRCSYLLTNMGLASFTNKMGVTQKLSGDEFDYSIIRYPWTDLSQRELEYCITDVKALVEALKVYFSIENDNYYSIPLTSTGFVRRDVKRAMRRFNKDDLKNQLPDYDIFSILREAFRGGNTHANRYYADMIVKGVSSFDRVSSYPDVQINELFPMGLWIHEPTADFERVIRKIYKQKRACLMRVAFHNIRLRDPMWGCPYIAKHKCRNLLEHDNDNGRILYASYLEISLTDIDFKIILDEYDFDEASVLDFYHCRYGRLPKPLRDTVQKYFRDKTELKNVAGSELFYMLSKAKLNSIYGMSVQSPVKQNIKYINDEFIIEHVNESELLDTSNSKAFLSYAWGVWTTARAREQLEIAIKMVGNNFVYCDTDSVKFIDDGSVDFEPYNEQRMNDSINNGGVAEDPKGKKHYLGLYEYDGSYKEFITLGAKKYAYVDLKDKLNITVAGVGKSKGAEELKQRGGLKSFKEGFTFYDAGGTESIYNDKPEIDKLMIDGHEIEITSNVLIRSSTYTLGVTGEYRRILEHPNIWLDLFD